MLTRAFTRCVLMLCLLMAVPSYAQQSEMFGDYELFYSVVNTTFLEPSVAATYNIKRGKKTAIVNLAVRQQQAVGSEPRPMLLQGKTWDLMQQQTLEFQEIREGEAIYYIAQFGFINEEWRFFEIDFRPEGATETYTFKFKHQLYIH